MSADQLVTFAAAIIGGALRVGAPFLFVSLGECLTEKSGRINLGHCQGMTDGRTAAHSRAMRKLLWRLSDPASALRPEERGGRSGHTRRIAGCWQSGVMTVRIGRSASHPE